MGKEIICPLCEGAKSINFFCRKNSHEVYNCSGCGLGFVWPIPLDSSEIYKEEYFKKRDLAGGCGYVDYEKDKGAMDRDLCKYLEKIESMTKGRTIFDFGAATGYFLDLAKQRGWNTAGAEISTYAAHLAERKGHTMFIGKLVDFQIKRKYSVVTMFDVLEHLDSPKSYLKKINSILEESGLLIISTIDKGSIWARFFGRYWHQMVPPEHLFYYRVMTMNILLEKTGFEILSIEKRGKNFSLPYIFNILYRWQNLKFWHHLANCFDTKFWRRGGFRINLRDSIFVIAKKKYDV